MFKKCGLIVRLKYFLDSKSTILPDPRQVCANFIQGKSFKSSGRIISLSTNIDLDELH